MPRTSVRRLEHSKESAARRAEMRETGDSLLAESPGASLAREGLPRGGDPPNWPIGRRAKDDDVVSIPGASSSGRRIGKRDDSLRSEIDSLQFASREEP